MDEEKVVIKFYHDRGTKTPDIVKALKKLKVGERKIYRTVKRLRETGSIDSRFRSGSRRTTRTKQVIKRVKDRFQKTLNDLSASSPRV